MGLQFFYRTYPEHGQELLVACASYGCSIEYSEQKKWNVVVHAMSCRFNLPCHYRLVQLVVVARYREPFVVLLVVVP